MIASLRLPGGPKHSEPPGRRIRSQGDCTRVDRPVAARGQLHGLRPPAGRGGRARGRSARRHTTHYTTEAARRRPARQYRAGCEPPRASRPRSRRRWRTSQERADPGQFRSRHRRPARRQRQDPLPASSHHARRAVRSDGPGLQDPAGHSTQSVTATSSRRRDMAIRGLPSQDSRPATDRQPPRRTSRTPTCSAPCHDGSQFRERAFCAVSKSVLGAPVVAAGPSRG